MKVLGISCGRKNSNTEILVKEALMGAEEIGAEVEIIRLLDLDIKPCTGCNSCVIDLFEKGGAGDCVIKNDDFPFIDDKILEADALVVGSPIYEKSPHGYLKVLNDRMGPSHDMAFRMIAKKIREEKGITEGKGPDERSFKFRPVSLFAVGGSDWVTLAMPMMRIFALPMQMSVIDAKLFNWVALPAVVTLKEDMLNRARKSGRHLAESVNIPVEEREYIGDPGLCPVCNNDVMVLSTDPDKAQCAVCKIKGELKTVGGKRVFEVSEEEKAKSSMTLSGKFSHAEDLKNYSLKPEPNMDEIPTRREKYRNYLQYSRP